MAADFIMPRLPGPQMQSIYQAQANTQFQPSGFQSQQYNPQISPLSTSNSPSPTSPKSYHTRQVRPLFMPAVLRPNEHPLKAPVAKSQQSESEDEDEDGVRSNNNSFISLPGLGALGRLSRRSTGDSGKSFSCDWNLDRFPKVTAMPTRNHWKPDPESSICDEPSCLKHFSYWTRRHHCRRCGNIFCDAHSNFAVPLDQDANYNPRGSPSRSCGHCFAEFKAWRSRTNSQASTDSTRHPHTTPSSPISASPAVRHGHQLRSAPDAAASVPTDWNWSTF